MRGAGFFHALELVKDKETKESFDDNESEELLQGLHVRRALPARADLPGGRPRRPRDPALAPADRGHEQFEEIDNVLRGVLTDAWERIVRR